MVAQEDQRLPLAATERPEQEPVRTALLSSLGPLGAITSRRLEGEPVEGPLDLARAGLRCMCLAITRRVSREERPAALKAAGGQEPQARSGLALPEGQTLLGRIAQSGMAVVAVGVQPRLRAAMGVLGFSELMSGSNGETLF